MAAPTRAPHAVRRCWLMRQLGWLALGAGALLWLFETRPVDLVVARWFFDAGLGAFPHRHEWLFDSLLHHGLKSLSVAAGLGAAGLAIAGAWGLWPNWPRRNALVAVLGMALIPLGTALLKHWTHRHCPWDLTPFGGFVPYTTLLQGAPEGYAPGQCFPAGHASGGFVWMVWGVALRPLRPRLARWALAGGLLLGLGMGTARMAQGAHFLSHTLWSAWFAWAAVVALAALCRADLGGSTPERRDRGDRIPASPPGPAHPSRVSMRAPSFVLVPALVLVLVLVLTLTSGQVGAQEPAPALPSFAELEAAGARIGTIRIINNDIFDTDDPKEDKAPFRWANALHIRTRAGVIERALLFKTGELLSVRLIDETERVLRSTRYLYDVTFRPAAYRDGVVDIEVETRDTWTLDPGVSFGRSGGANSGGINLKEYNLLGSGIALSLGHSRNVDRSSNEFQISNQRAFGSWTSLTYSHASNSDGQRDAASIVRPFYALDTRWAAGITASKDDRIESVYNAGNLVRQYRHRETLGEVFGGWSPGLREGWVQRYSLGASLQEDRYAPGSDLPAPAGLPPDEKLVAPFVRFELIEDHFDKQRNRNLIGRPEFFALGFASTLQLGWASTGLGSSHEALLYTASVSRGFEPAPEHTLTTALSITGQRAGGQLRRQRLGAQVRYYWPQSPRWLFYAAASGDAVTRPNPEDLLLLGGDNGLRGYPLRYQSGERRALFTLEERYYTDLYLLRLFHVGGAAFFDAGRAWGGSETPPVNPGWLRNVGFGLRFVSSRAAFSNVLHVDLAFPLDPTDDVKRVQFLVKTRTSF